MKIKVCGMRIPENIAAVTELGIDYMGFIFYAPSPRYVLDESERKIVLHKKIKGVGVFVNEEIDRVQTFLEKHKLSYVQLHGEETPAYCEQLKEAGFTILKAFCVNKDFDFNTLEKYVPVCDYFLFDTKGKTHGGTGKKFNWDILQQYTYNKPFFLSGGIGPEDTEAVLNFKHPQFYGVDLNSRFEIEAGEKNVELLEQWLENK
ncbi:MAG: phosphoribosylanthranilate isomerase [Saprospiraceae bacterium]